MLETIQNHRANKTGVFYSAVLKKGKIKNFTEHILTTIKQEIHSDQVEFS